MGESMPRQKRDSHKTPLALFLRKVLKERDISILEASRIAGCAPSVLHGWLQGAYPSETIDKVKRLANHFGYSLAIAMSGEPDQLSKKFIVLEEPDVGAVARADRPIRVRNKS
jgi:hypothetical protein